jgi:uncharacterized cupredoxin-like copper-binding protein
MRRRLLVAPLLAVLAACDSGDGAPKATPAAGDERVIQVEMRDIAFAPTTLAVRPGERVRFVFKNRGALTHDGFLGDAAAQDRHEQDARAGHGAGPDAVSVRPGKTAELSYTFDRPGQILLGCHQPGHYTGGMKAAITVA